MKNVLLMTTVAAISANAFAASSVVGEPKVLGDKFGFVEGPVWDEANQRFLFSDIPNSKTWAYDMKGTLSVLDKESGFANGLAIDKQGNLWAARHDRKLSFVQSNGTKVVAAATYNGKPLNSPNDVTVNSDGSVWFTDPPFGIQGYGPQKAEEEQPVRGIYRYQDGDFRLVSGALKLPNGIAFSPDESLLYVADTSDGWVYRFDVDGKTVSNKQRFAKVHNPAAEEPMADGITVAKDGTVYVAGPGGVGVFTPKGKQTDFIAVDSSHISNVALGGKHQSKLMVTAANKVLLFTLK